MKNVLYDHQTFSVLRFGGISRYFYELIKNSEDLYCPKLSGAFFCNEHLKYLPGFNKEFPIKKHFPGKRTLFSELGKMMSLWEISKSNHDVFHPTNYHWYSAAMHNKPMVVTVYDMNYELFPDNEAFAKCAEIIRKKRLFIENADKIITISQNTKNDLLRIYPRTDEKKISVIYLGNSFPLSDDVVKKKNKKNILFTGNRRGYKNFDMFVNAVSSILTKYDLNLMCTGSQFNDDEVVLFEKLGIKNRVRCFFASEDALKKLYEDAICFVYPSISEGFGIPILEAFSSNCPCILSNASCFPEIAGNAVEYFDPHSVNDMRNVIEKVVCSPTLRNEMVLKGRTALQKYSWRKCAEEHAEVYNQL